MQVLDEKKQSAILDAAAELFASLPFHKVTLSQVAARAGVGKGTLYTYFKNKEDLYLSVLYGGFSSLVDSISEKICLSRRSPSQNLEHVIREILGFAFDNPHLYQVMRRLGTGYGAMIEKWQGKRNELKEIFEEIIVQGIGQDEFYAPNPELTAWLIPGIIRNGVIRFGRQMDQEVLTLQILDFVFTALKKPTPGGG